MARFGTGITTNDSDGRPNPYRRRGIPDPCLAAAGIEDSRFRDLRHECGSRLVDADVNLKKIARLMGHSNTKQTERYIHPADDGLLAATGIAAQARRTTIVPQKLRQAG
ncbi:MAG TPA: tyrosine-type recombinase/integrase [Pyrinomonadaceae bacterium]